MKLYFSMLDIATLVNTETVSRRVVEIELTAEQVAKLTPRKTGYSAGSALTEEVSFCGWDAIPGAAKEDAGHVL